MAEAEIRFDDEVVIYHSREDGCWIAHSLRTDQIGAGDRIVDALATLIRGIHELCKLAAEDESIAYLREAPSEIQKLFHDAASLPLEIYEVAHKMATGQWPQDLKVDITPDQPDRPLKATVRESVSN